MGFAVVLLAGLLPSMLPTIPPMHLPSEKPAHGNATPSPQSTAINLPPAPMPAFTASTHLHVSETVPPGNLARPEPTLRPVSVQLNDHGTLQQAALTRYDAHMASFRTPAVMTFEYTLEQAGDHNITQTHRIYRSKNVERDEIISTGDTKITKPKIRISHMRPNPYLLENLAPRSSAYTFTYMGQVADGTHIDYLYRTTPRSRASLAYTVTSIVIDGRRFLPVSIDFSANAAPVIAGLGSSVLPAASAPPIGTGRLRFGDMGGGWVVNEVEASASVGKNRLRERIVWHGYRFPKSLPPSTFGN
jgi:hypothetical protein